jgi:hypothetical protein
MALDLLGPLTQSTSGEETLFSTECELTMPAPVHLMDETSSRLEQLTLHLQKFLMD